LLSINEIKPKDPLLDAKIEEVCIGLQRSYVKNLRSISIENNIVTIINYINSMKTELNLSFNYRRDLIKLLTRFSEVNNKNLATISNLLAIQ
jgi:hypothetical protein